MSIAITAGSRGVANVDTITRAIVDFITKRMFDKLDPEMIYPNCFTSTVIRSGMMPPVVATDKEAIQACILTANQIDKKRPRIVRIKNTLHVGRIMLSEVYYEDVVAGKYPGLTALDEEPSLIVFTEWMYPSSVL